MKSRILPAIMVIVLISILLTGCWDLKDIDERATVLAIGIDYADIPQPGNFEGSYMVKVTLQIAISEQMTGGAGQAPPMGEQVVWNISSTGATMARAIELCQEKLKYSLFFGHVRILIFGQKVAQNGVNQFLNYFRNHPMFRRLSYILVSKGDAADVLKTFPKSATIQAMFLMNMVETAQNTGRMPDIPFMEFVVRLIDKGIDPVAIMVSSHKDSVVNTGVAVFRGDNMVGSLDLYETWNFIQITENQRGGIEVVRDVEDELGRVTIQLTGVNSNVRPIIQKNGKVKFIIDMEVEGRIVSQETQTDYNDPVLFSALEERVEKEYKRELEQMINKVQKQFKADIFGFGQQLRAYQNREWKEINNWRKAFSEGELDLTIYVDIRRMGMSTFTKK
ncbi:Ger(x)C family spore germination protein [Halothermothrix orenii]|uniref:Spore germination B3 GerAC family protein n=1 Tax=Halothermothrix orenii (strain H 168 / OCM 544 / DSM 9562) TaxID=373903 RepID=B8CZP5_HALOH|nr:Ger(x)C family spore germination protein [Halothermothrix orenii]ACL68775.1 spore germination B3 GerAC family protein [Halothermothrix orenii H 168]